MATNSALIPERLDELRTLVSEQVTKLDERIGNTADGKINNINVRNRATYAAVKGMLDCIASLVNDS